MISVSFASDRFLNQSQSKVKQNQCNTRLLSTLIYLTMHWLQFVHDWNSTLQRKQTRLRVISIGKGLLGKQLTNSYAFTLNLKLCPSSPEAPESKFLHNFNCDGLNLTLAVKALGVIVHAMTVNVVTDPRASCTADKDT